MSSAWPYIIHRAHAVGMPVHTEPWHIHIIGERGKDRRAGRWDDFIHIARVDEAGNWQFRKLEATVDPGAYYSETGHLMNRRGVARMVSPQYVEGYFEPGPHGKAKYRALRQVEPAWFWREDDGDHIHGNDPTTTRERGVIYANLHAASTRPYDVDVAPEFVGRWSAACQVVRRTPDFRLLMSWVDEHIRAGHSRRIDYTLVDAV